MKTIKTDIIPKSSTFFEVVAPKELDLKAICVFVATGFFLDTDTYWLHKKVLKPGCVHSFDDKNQLVESKLWFQWHYSPREISFEQALDEFSNLFEGIMEEQTKNKNVILPLSGGLDSRTQATALKKHPNVNSYSYAFEDGYPEHKIAKEIADKMDFKFEQFQVKKGYLWDCIEELAEINQCYSDFTHPRQMAFIDEYTEMGDVFSLGHWGDVLFDSFNLPELTLDGQVAYILKKIVVKGGMELGTNLWNSWGLKGTFKEYLRLRINELLTGIKIENTNAKLRAFKSMFWAPRWTSINLAVFEKVAPITIPYYDNRMCEFICTIPEAFLVDRKLQIAYIKRNAPELAKITWQGQKPFNLNNYHWNKSAYSLPYRISNKFKREFNGFMGKPYISRNWELQFIGKENNKELKKWLFDSGLSSLVPEEIIKQFYNNFKEKDSVQFAHPISMLLTLALFNLKFNQIEI